MINYFFLQQHVTLRTATSWSLTELLVKQPAEDLFGSPTPGSQVPRKERNPIFYRTNHFTYVDFQTKQFDACLKTMQIWPQWVTALEATGPVLCKAKTLDDKILKGYDGQMHIKFQMIYHLVIQKILVLPEESILTTHQLLT